MTRNPIYKDTVYTSTESTLRYRIESPKGTVLLKGVASERPDGTPIEIYVNRLCEPFLSQSVKVEEGITTDPDAVRTFYLYNDLNNTLLETYAFIRAYSGEWNGSDRILNDPIRPNVSHNMLLPFSAYLANGSDISINGDKEQGGGDGSPDYYLYFDKRNPATYYEAEVPADFDPNDNVSSAFKGKKVYVAYSNFINLKTLFKTLPQVVLTNNNGLIRPILNSDNPPYGAIVGEGSYYYWCDEVIDYTGGFPYICFYVTPNETFSPREATFEFYYKDKLLCTLKITQPTIAN